MATFDLTVSIVSYNTKTLVRQAIRTVKEKTEGINYQIIVIDNESKDGTPEMVEEEFSDVMLIRSGRNMGFSSANNLALKIVDSRYFVLFNSDASLINNALAELVWFMDKNPDCGIACPQLYYPDETVQKAYYPFRNPKRRGMREVSPRIKRNKGRPGTSAEGCRNS